MKLTLKENSEKVLVFHKILYCLFSIWYLEHDFERNFTLSARLQRLCGLRIFRTGIYQLVAGELINVHSRTFNNVINCLLDLKPLYITMPNTQERRSTKKAAFYRLGGFPNIIESIDCSYFRILCADMYDRLLVSDSGYALSPSLMTTVLQSRTQTRRRYNRAHTLFHNIMKRSFRVLKKILQVLKKCSIIVALHFMPAIQLWCLCWWYFPS